jgi:hypothetical protein
LLIDYNIHYLIDITTGEDPGGDDGFGPLCDRRVRIKVVGCTFDSNTQ